MRYSSLVILSLSDSTGECLHSTTMLPRCSAQTTARRIDWCCFNLLGAIVCPAKWGAGQAFPETGIEPDNSIQSFRAVCKLSGSPTPETDNLSLYVLQAFKDRRAAVHSLQYFSGSACSLSDHCISRISTTAKSNSGSAYPASLSARVTCVLIFRYGNSMISYPSCGCPCMFTLS